MNAPTFRTRGELLSSPGSRRETRAGALSFFVRDLEAFDRHLELWYWGPAERWVIYSRRGTGLSTDTMAKEFELVGPGGERREPGQWAIREMQKLDLTKRYGTLSAERAHRLWLDDLTTGNATRRAERRTKAIREANVNAAHALSHTLKRPVVK